MKSKLVYIIIALVFIGGCVTGELSTNHGDVDVDVDWEGLTDDLVPKSLTANFYGGSAESQHYFYDDTSSKATVSLFKEQLPAGTYKMLAYSTDEVDIAVRGIEIFEKAQAILKMKSSTTKSLTLTFDQPTYFYALEMEDPLADIVVTAAVPSKIILKPYNYIKPVTVKVNMTGNVELLGSSAVSLGGIANGINLSTGVPFSDTGKENIVMTRDISPDNFLVTLNVFGVAKEASNKLTVDLFFADGRSQKIDWDVTGEFADLNELKSPGKKIEVELDIYQDSEALAHGTLISWKIDTLALDMIIP